jgi:hypothetical protein
MADGFWSIIVYDADGYFDNRPWDLSVPPRLGNDPFSGLAAARLP